MTPHVRSLTPTLIRKSSHLLSRLARTSLVGSYHHNCMIKWTYMVVLIIILHLMFKRAYRVGWYHQTYVSLLCSLFRKMYSVANES
uniref:Uncharacterized protein n=1 Tax=Arundo donax TaxID=35708 RepID=A0A0A9G129_ARUDO